MIDEIKEEIKIRKNKSKIPHECSPKTISWTELMIIMTQSLFLITNLLMQRNDSNTLGESCV